MGGGGLEKGAGGQFQVSGDACLSRPQAFAFTDPDAWATLVLSGKLPTSLGIQPFYKNSVVGGPLVE